MTDKTRNQHLLPKAFTKQNSCKCSSKTNFVFKFHLVRTNAPYVALAHIYFLRFCKKFAFYLKFKLTLCLFLTQNLSLNEIYSHFVNYRAFGQEKSLPRLKTLQYSLYTQLTLLLAHTRGMERFLASPLIFFIVLWLRKLVSITTQLVSCGMGLRFTRFSLRASQCSTFFAPKS